jgi:hypothetical protein
MDLGALNDPNLRMVELDTGAIVPQRVVDIVETIEEIWPGKLVVNINRDYRPSDEHGHKYVICEWVQGKQEPVFWIKDEDEFTGEIIERLILADNSRGNVLTRMQARNAALRALQKKVAKDQMAEKADIAASVMKSPLNTYRLGKGQVIKDYGNG